MIKKEDIFYIEKLFNNKKIVYFKLLSNSFNINCIKIVTNDNEKYVVKYYNKVNTKFNAIESEISNLKYFSKKKIKFFPKVYSKNNKYLIINYLENNDAKPNEIKIDFLKAIVSIHSINRQEYGFDFDTQIGGLKQDNSKSKNWIEFYRDNRLGYIFNLINKTNPMNASINSKIENLINKLENFIPRNPESSLLHGDLWEGNILFKNKKFIGFIDPGSFYGHNELEIAYLRWFNPDFIKNGFLEKYNEFIRIDKEYLNYEAVYQIYYSLLNVYLWDRIYINDVDRLLKKIKI